jgi:hypothetical protein
MILGSGSIYWFKNWNVCNPLGAAYRRNSVQESTNRIVQQFQLGI